MEFLISNQTLILICLNLFEIQLWHLHTAAEKRESVLFVVIAFTNHYCMDFFRLPCLSPLQKETTS